MSGIYIHIPFCKQACSYCDFYFTTHLLNKNDFLNALHKEIEHRKNYVNGQTIETIYFGGGTPSQLSTSELHSIIVKIKDSFNLVNQPEITLESNPDNLTENYLLALKEIGVNRLSIGIQSFFYEDLELMNRAHKSEQAIECVQTAREVGFNNISIDLIYGLPNSNLDKWLKNIKTAISLNPEHISAYNLTIEEGTPLAYSVMKNRVNLSSDEEVVAQHNLLVESLEKAGFEHYETSNFAKAGYRSKHNSSYWRGSNYLGLGPSAHSYNGSSRSWNIASTKKYVEAINNGENFSETETLTETDKINEFIMTGLRTVEGINLLHFEENFGSAQKKQLLSASEKHLQKKLLKQSENRLYITPNGKVLLDGITADLFIE